MNTHPWHGKDLGERTISYDEDDVILYALAIGADPVRHLDLVYERDLKVMPTFALTLGQWAPDELGKAGAIDTTTALHGAQRLEVHRAMPSSGSVTMTAHVAAVWDKGAAAVFDLVVRSEYFDATWSLFAPGAGGFGGERGPRADGGLDGAPEIREEIATAANQAALYRLLGDRHAMHIDPVAAQQAGGDRPFMHGLCTLAAAALRLCDAAGSPPAELKELEARFAAPVYPGDTLELAAQGAKSALRFELSSGGSTVLSQGRAVL